MLDLPTELWRHIAHFLPPEEIKRLYSVNQTFYHLAMDETYREARFDCVNRDLLHNVDSLISRYRSTCPIVPYIISAPA